MSAQWHTWPQPSRWTWSSSDRKVRWQPDWWTSSSRKGSRLFGPSKAAARLEGSKQFAKEIMDRAGVPTAGWQAFTDRETAIAYLAGRSGPYVVKADGLAAGKGVLVTEDRSEAQAWVDRCLDGGFGAAGNTVVIEDFLDGPELSVFAICDGTSALPLAPARDYKRLSDGDAGPNTGGMGCYSPVDDLPEGIVQSTLSRRHQSGARNPGGGRNPLYRVHLRGSRIDRRRTQGPRVQLPIGRPGDTGRAAEDGLRPARVAAVGTRRDPGRGDRSTGSTVPPSTSFWRQTAIPSHRGRATSSRELRRRPETKASWSSMREPRSTAVTWSPQEAESSTWSEPRRRPTRPVRGRTRRPPRSPGKACSTGEILPEPNSN